MKNVDWAEVGIAVAVGLVIGVSLPLLLYWLGLPGKLVGPMVGAFTAPAVGITYQIRMKRRPPPDQPPG
jgi:4-hydroxybenzoate polyprenyltransferase